MSLPLAASAFLVSLLALSVMLLACLEIVGMTSSKTPLVVASLSVVYAAGFVRRAARSGD